MIKELNKEKESFLTFSPLKGTSYKWKKKKKQDSELLLNLSIE